MDVAICTGRVEAKAFECGKQLCLVRCNLHGACGGKGAAPQISHAGLWRCNLHGACGGKATITLPVATARRVAICTGRVEAKRLLVPDGYPEEVCCNLHGACGGKDVFVPLHPPSGRLQSARGVWRQRQREQVNTSPTLSCNLHGACGGKGHPAESRARLLRCNLHGACGGKEIKKGWFYHV